MLVAVITLGCLVAILMNMYQNRITNLNKIWDIRDYVVHNLSILPGLPPNLTGINYFRHFPSS